MPGESGRGCAGWASEEAPGRFHRGGGSAYSSRDRIDLLSKLGEWASALSKQAGLHPSKADAAVAALDEIVGEMEAQRIAARAQLSATPAGDSRDLLERAIGMLEAKIEEVEEKRRHLRQRLARTSRKREHLESAKALVEEGKRLIAEGEALAGGEESDARAGQIRQRLAEIDVEVQELKRQIR